MWILKSGLVLFVVSIWFLGGCIGAEDDPELVDDGTGDESDPAGIDAGSNASLGVIQEFSAGWAVGLSGCPNVLYLESTHGVDSAWATIPSAAQGRSFNASFESAAPALSYGVSFWAGEESAGTFESAQPDIQDTVPDGADEAIFWTCGGADVALEFIVTSSG